MKKVLPVALIICNIFFSVTAFGQNPISFTNANDRLNNANFHSGVSISVADMDGDGMDDIARMDQGYDLYMEVQKTGGKFTTTPALSTGSGSAWAMVVGDADNNGRKDVAVGFGSGAKVVMSNAAFNSFTISTLPNSNYFLQNMSFADINNDGWLDIWGCNDVGTSKMWGNNGSGAYPATTNFFSPATYPASDNSGNYGNIFTDFDNDGDVDMYVAHCRQGVNSPTDPRRINQLFINNGTTYVLDSFNTRGLNSGAQTWTSSFEDIDNDGDFDCLLTNHDVPSVIMRNNGSGFFTDVTAASGFDIGNVTPIQSKMEDFDNDGYVDILISGGDEVLFRNNGNGTFSEVLNAFDNNDMESFAIGDLNHDGKIDVYAGYASIYTTPTNVDDVIWLNNSQNNNHFLTFVLQGTTSNRDALGAKVRIYGSFGQQVREVRAGESYGTTNTFHLHFGLGAATSVDSAVVYWPSGQTTTLLNRAADQFITVIEGQCASLDNIVTSVGPAVLCPGQTVTLSAPVSAGATYLWSTNETTQNIVVDSAGEYNVKVVFNNGCASTSKTVAVTVNPDETPAVMAVNDETVFCEGSSIQLASTSQASSFLWSNGDTSHVATITAPGTYTLTIQGACAPYTSAPITVSMIASNVTTTPAANCGPSAVTLGANASGTAHWYDAASGGNEVAVGNSFTTPVLNASATYYVQSFDTVMGLGGNVGPVDTSIGPGALYNSNQAQIFTVMKPCILRSVKVYAGSPGSRTVELRASNNTTILQSQTVTLVAGMNVINLNFPLAVGSNYRLGWTNNSNPNWWRNSSGANYPYTISNLISITGNTANDLARWYGYYDWRVEEEPVACASTVTPVTATINTLPVAAINGVSATYFNTDGTVTLNGTPAGGTFSGPGVTGNTFNPDLAEGNYTITYSYTDNNGCSDVASADVTVAFHVGVNDVAFNQSFELFPNPTNGLVNIKAKNALNGAVEMQLIDLTGKLVMSRTVNMDNSNVTTLDLSGFAKGLYNLKLTQNNQSHTVKVSLQ
jgi:hypothetical protein